MAHRQLVPIVILSLITFSLQDVSDNKIEGQEESPLAEVAKEILKEKNLENIGGIVNSFIQSGGAKNILDGVMQNLDSKENSGQLLESLGNFLNSATDDGPKKSKDEVDPMELLSGLGSLVGAMQGAQDGGQGNPAALLQGIGSLISAATTKDENGGAPLIQGLGSLLSGAQGATQGALNPELIGNFINMFANTQEDQPERKPNPSKMKKSKKSSSGRAKKNKKHEKYKDVSKRNFDGIFSLLASSGLDLNWVFDNFPMIVQMAKSLGGANVKVGDNMIASYDIIYVYEQLKGVDKDVNLNKILPRLLKIYMAYQELIASQFNSNDQDQSFDYSTILNVASSFLNQASNSKEGSNFMDYLPMIMNTISSFTSPEAQERATTHAGHSKDVPPILERIHIYFDHFVNSDMGKQLQEYITEQKAFKVFQDERGDFDYNKFKVLLENHSFRRHWIQQLTNKLITFLQIVSDETTQKRYIEMGISFTNSFLQSSGFPKKALLSTKNPVKSISNFANFAAKKYLDAELNTKEYVEPIVLYTQDLLKMARASIAPGAKTGELADKLTDIINMEIIEPITRVNRAYRFAKTETNCDRYVFCLVNQQEATGRIPKIRKGLYKGYSLIALWFLSSNTGTSYWDYYAAVAGDSNCQVFYNDSCNRFHEEEVKATTEYIHTEL